MSRVLLVVPSRDAGWRPEGVVPLLQDAESATHAALCRAGLAVQVIGEHRGDLEAALRDHDFVVTVHPSDGSLRAIQAALKSRSASLLRIQGWRKGKERGPRFFRSVRLSTPGALLTLSRLPRSSPIRGWRQRASFPPLAVLRPGPDDEIVGRWDRGGAALVRRTMGRLTIWTSAVPPDHLSPGDLARFLGLVAPDSGATDTRRDPVPGHARAAVILLHDVEDPLPDDPRGLMSVREGTEACLEAENRRGIRATYNLVGTFAEQIEDLVRRIVSEGHELASHGASHRELTGLEPALLREEIVGAEDRIGHISGERIRGFRSPRSRWSGALLDVLAERGYLWNAEADDSPYPYPVPRAGGGDLVRVPVAVDDWDYVRNDAKPRQVLDLWKREVMSAERRRCWTAIGSHPSVLGARAGRIEAFHQFLDWLSTRDVRTMTLGGASAWWRERVSAAAGSREASS